MSNEFIRGEYLGHGYYCFYFGGVKESESVEKMLSRCFDEYLRKQVQKKKYLTALSYIFLNLFRRLKSIEMDLENDGLLFLDYDYRSSMMKDTGYVLKFSYHKGNYYYQYGRKRINQSFLIGVMKDLEQMDYMKHEDGNYVSYKPSFQYIHWKKIYEDLYKEHREIILKALERSIPRKKQGEIVIKVRNEEGEWVAIDDKIQMKSLCRRKELVETKEYIKQLREMYDNMNVKLSYFDEGLDIHRKQILELYNKNHRDGCFRKETFNRNVDLRNAYLTRKFLPYRTYHLSGKKLSWGRVYGSMLDSYVSNIYKPLLKIDNQYSLSIDIKSSLIQFYILTECNDVDNRQDFYRYNDLEALSLKRDDVKLISQCFLYNENELSAWRAYNQKCWLNKDYTKISYEEWKTKLIPLMKKQKPYLFEGLFFNKEKCKSLILKESEFMMNLSKELMSNQLRHISCFDALYIGYRNMDKVLGLFKDVSLRMFGRSINVDYDEETLNDLRRVDI